MENIKQEIWKNIPGWKGYYQVSTQGKVRSVTRVVGVLWKGRKKEVRYTGKLLKAGTIKNGYQTVNLSRNSRTSYRYIHQIVLLAFRGAPPKGYECCHNNGIRQDNRLENLRYDSRSNNALDRHKHGTFPNREGENGIASKLNNKKVKWIRENYGRVSFREMGRRFGVAHGTISAAVNRRSWRNI